MSLNVDGPGDSSSSPSNVEGPNEGYPPNPYHQQPTLASRISTITTIPEKLILQLENIL